MQLITLNTWGGRIFDELSSFLKENRSETDIFCFQEVYSQAGPDLMEAPETRLNLFAEFEGLLPDFTGHFAPQITGTGLAIFVKKKLEISEIGSSTILSASDLAHFKMPSGNAYYPRIVQYLSIKDHNLSVYNFHGVPGAHKQDTPERDLQIKRLGKHLASGRSQKILVGDFNLNPDTNAIRTLERTMKNLMNGSPFTTTRSSYYKNREKLPFADYIFLSQDITVNDFRVIPDEISDHLPLLVQFSV